MGEAASTAAISREWTATFSIVSAHIVLAAGYKPDLVLVSSNHDDISFYYFFYLP